jgi:hypothetical protein
MTEFLAVAIICCAAVFFMLIFLRALLAEAKPAIRISQREKREKRETRTPERKRPEGISPTPVSADNTSPLDRAA